MGAKNHEYPVTKRANDVSVIDDEGADCFIPSAAGLFPEIEFGGELRCIQVNRPKTEAIERGEPEAGRSCQPLLRAGRAMDRAQTLGGAKTSIAERTDARQPSANTIAASHLRTSARFTRKGAAPFFEWAGSARSAEAQSSRAKLRVHSDPGGICGKSAAMRAPMSLRH
ncbi:MAG TPA: hypothetical protein DEA40_15645 [Parvularcula sp.]|nr:hypothetical protein [Parvularcula sp.]HBS34123.1 hypothetical protein [Parvularcula sp.]